MPWSCGWVLLWDATCPDTLAPSHIALDSREPGLVAEQAELQQKIKYADLLATHYFVPTGVFGHEAPSFHLGRHLKAHSGEPLSFSHLLQQIGVTIQGGSTATVLSTAPGPWPCRCLHLAKDREHS